MQDLVQVLTKFHREIVLPDVQRIVGNAVDGLRGEMNARFNDVSGHLDAIYQRFDKLETEYHIKTLESRLDG